MLLVIGGHTKNVGKTSVVAGLLAALPQFHWTAIKITQSDHDVDFANHEPRGRILSTTTFALSEECIPSAATDTSRFLAAGAARVFWVRTRPGHLSDAMPHIQRLLAESGNVLIESNSILSFLHPDLYLSVLDPSLPDFKPSALRFLDCADALILPKGATLQSLTQAWPRIPSRHLTSKPLFFTNPPVYCSDELIRFVSIRLLHQDLAARNSWLETS